MLPTAVHVLAATQLGDALQALSDLAHLLGNQHS